MSRTLPVLRCALVCLGIIAPLAQTFADPVAIRIVQGSIVVGEVLHVSGPIDISGTEGFHWTSFATSGGRFTCHPCRPGETMSFSTTFRHPSLDRPSATEATPGRLPRLIVRVSCKSPGLTSRCRSHRVET